MFDQIQMIEPEDQKRELQVTDFVEVEHFPMAPIPAGDNPFWHDLSSMGTDLVRGWLVMHDGFDRKEEPRPLQGLYLVNQRTGQRIGLRFRPATK